MSSTPSIRRPYTSYNLFFQLEREYILQTILGHAPKVAAEEVFDPNDKTNYEGPPLPSRYADLVLLRDWHVPGKMKRRKRSHRKSHGKIGLHDLNEQVSKAWSVVDDETRTFCVVLSEIESKKYKKATAPPANKKSNSKVKNEPKKEPTKESNANKAKTSSILSSDELINSFDAAFRSFGDNFSTQLDRNKISRVVSCEPNRDNPQQTGESPKKSVVDMADDEIINIWNSITEKTTATKVTSTPIITATATKATTNECDPSTLPGHVQEREESRSAPAGRRSRASFIDKEYDIFKEIGQQFLTKQRILRKMSSQVLRNGYAACEA